MEVGQEGGAEDEWRRGGWGGDRGDRQRGQRLQIGGNCMGPWRVVGAKSWQGVRTAGQRPGVEGALRWEKEWFSLDPVDSWELLKLHKQRQDVSGLCFSFMVLDGRGSRRWGQGEVVNA